MSDPKAAAGALVGVVGGSRSDFPVLEQATAMLDRLEIRNELRVVSAHRSPDHLYRYAESARGRGIRVIIAGAGGAAHLPGMLAAKTTLPVIGVIPVATVAIGNAENAALLAAEILALGDAALATRLEQHRRDQAQAVLDDPSNAAPLWKP